MKRLDLRRYPYRGIIKDIADEMGVKPCTVHNSLFGSETPSPRYAEVFQRHLEARIAASKELTRSLRETLRKAV
ncbi:MAG: hypothetical protein HGB04_01725 [Chlorobiaceae bacterium]|nr:hypothetical protein [Chlorobiaceae bacterium]